MKNEAQLRPNLKVTDGYYVFRRVTMRETVFLYSLYGTNLLNQTLSLSDKTQLNERDEINDSIWFV